MNTKPAQCKPVRIRARLLALAAAAFVAACGGDASAPPPPPPPAVGSSTLGTAGGVVDGPDGTRLVVPAGAVATSTTFRIARTAAGAPELAGLNAVSPVYEVTPHDTPFGTSAMFSLPLSAAQVPAGATPVLLKASPGQPWRVMNDTRRVAGALSADLDTLSWFVLAYCQTSNAGGGAWVIGAPDCPTSNSLTLELLDSNGTPIAVAPGNNGTLPPYVTVTGPTTLNFRITWNRPNTTRTDQVSVTGTGGFRPGFTSTWGALASPGGVVTTTTSYSVGFSVSIDPAVIAAGGPREVRVNARADYTTTALAVGRGNVAAGFAFETYIPILVRYTGTAPSITQQPTPASVSVVENNAFTLTAAATGPNLSYEWRYFQNATDSAVRLAEGTSNQASYTSPPAQIGWNGRLYYVYVCTNRGVAGLERCAASQASPLTVTPFTQPIAFTAQPVARDILEGESTDFNAAVTGTPTPTLQWFYGVTCSTNFFGVRSCNGTAFANGAGNGPFAGGTVAGANAAILTLSSVPLTANGAQIALRAEQPGALPQWSTAAGLTVRARPVAAGFVQQLQSRSVQQNGSVDFSVVTSGTAPINYDWSIDAVPVSVSGTLISGRCAGATVSFPNESTLRLTNVPLGCDGAVIAVGIDNAGTPAGMRPTSTALLTVTATPTPPSITANPAPSTVSEGQRATLTVGYGGTLPQTLTLQCLNCAQIGTGVSTTSQQCASPCSLQTPVLDATDNGNQYRIVHSNAQGDTATSPVTITVNIARTPAFTTQPVGATVDSGQTAIFSFAVGSDTGSFSYQWLANGQPLLDGSNVAGNGALQGATVSGASGSSTSGTLTVANVPLAANGVALTVRVTRTAGGQSRQGTSNAAALAVNVAVSPNALTATQIVAGPEWSMVLRPDRTVWAWGRMHRIDGRVQNANLNPADQALRPVRMYPSVLSDVRAISGWSSAFWALTGEPGTPGSRVLHWGRAIAGSDGRGGDGNGSLGSSIPPRDNEAAPVEVLERVDNVPQPVDRVCAIAGGGEQLAMIRAINNAGTTTDCNAGSAKTVWFVGSLLGQGYGSTGVAFAMPGLPSDSPPVTIFTGQTTSGSPGLAIALEDGRIYGLGANPYGGFGVPSVGGGPVGGLAGPLLLPSTWGSARSFGMSFYYSLFVVRADGSVMTSGYDSSGELGFGSAIGGSRLGPLPVLSEGCTGLPCADVLTGVSAIVSTNLTTTLALKNGQILGWGASFSGLLGPGVTGAQLLPRPVPSTVSGFSALSAADKHALVIGPGNVVYAWGSGLRGALGDGVDGNTRTSPGMVTTGP
jgi:alpha-tubulin suppressor-like RCC1 family protein